MIRACLGIWVTRFIKFIAIAAILSTTFGQSVLALTDAERKHLFTPFYDPTAVEGCANNALFTSSENAAKVYRFFTGKGYSPEQTAGIIGNMKAESAIQPMRLQNTPPDVRTPAQEAESRSLGWGLVQWTPPSKMITPLRQEGATYEQIETVEQQVEFLWRQLEGTAPSSNEKSAGDHLKQQTTVAGAAESFMTKYERPRDQSAAKIAARVSLAEASMIELGAGPSGDALESGCASGLKNVQCPTDLQSHPTQNGYFLLPEAPNEEYVIYSRPEARYGSKQLVCAIYSVSLAFNEAMEGRSRLRIGDLNARGHKSHNTGVAVDLSGFGELQVASHSKSWKGEYDKDATVLLGKMFADTGALRNIWWCDPGDDSIEQILAYAQTKGLQGQIKCIDGHDDHFHVDVKTEYRLPFWEP